MDDFEIEVTNLRPGADGQPEASGISQAPDPRRARGPSPLARRLTSHERALRPAPALGVLLAADSATQQELTALPVPSQNERAIIAQLAPPIAG
ncbi:MAG: hypothetical protein ACHQ4H_11330 [Ktedonobacterales bacterium]